MAVKKITAQNFRRYGWVIGFPNKHFHGKKSNLFRVAVKENNETGWRIAYLVVREKSITRLEQHPESFESFEPVKGRSLLYISNSKNRKKITCFYLDKPVILKKGIWHGVVTLGAETDIKITENAKVESIYWELGMELNCHHSC